MKKNYSFIDLWDLEKNNIDKKKLPKSLIKGYELRKEQLKYKFNQTSNNNNILNKFRDFANQPSNIINPDSFIEKVKKNFEKEKKLILLLKILMI
jgi:leucyl aminopeptidase